MYVFENLEIYTSAVGFSAAVDIATESFPSSTDYFGDRLRRAARAIPSQVAEAHGHWKDEERREFFWKAREATQECAGLIEIAARQTLMDEVSRMKLWIRLDTLQKMIQDSLHKTERKPEPAMSGAGSVDLKIF